MRVLTTCLMLFSGVAHAHGPAPAALSASGSDLAVIRTNIGLAYRRADAGYRYVCPATWDSDEQFPDMARLPDGRVVVAFREAIYVIAADGCGRVVYALPEPGGATAILSDGARVLVATRDAEGSRVWSVDGIEPPQPIARLDRFVDSMVRTPDGRILLAAARPEAALIDLAGDTEPLDFTAAFLALRGGGRFLRASTDQGVVVLEDLGDRWVERARAERSVHGPVRFEGGWLAVIDGWIHRRLGEEGELVRLREARWTCLERHGESVVTCADFGLARVTADLQAEPIFTLSELVGVECPDDPATHARCEGQWLHFGAEAGLVGPFETAPEPEPAPPVTPDEPAQGDDDCATAPGRSGRAWLLVLLPLVLRRRIATLRPTAFSGQIRSQHVQVPDSGRGHRRCRADRL